MSCVGVVFFFTLAIISATSAQGGAGGDLRQLSLSDLRIVYFFEDPEQIDWAAVALLAEHRGCQVTLASARHAERYLHRKQNHPDLELTLIELYLREDNLDSLMIGLDPRGWPPDIVIFGAGRSDTIWRKIEERFLSGELDPDTSKLNGLLGLRKVYRSRAGESSGAISHGAIVNQRELLARYASAIRAAKEVFFPELTELSDAEKRQGLFSRYELARYSIAESFRESEFLSGMRPLRLESLVRAALPESAARTNHVGLAERFRSDFDAARQAGSPKERVNLLVAAYRALSKLEKLTAAHEVARTAPLYQLYISSLATRVQRVTLAAMGLEWRGDITVRDSPEGPKVKFRATLSVSGPLGVSLARALFYPTTGDSAVVVEGKPQEVRPHQQLVREYLINTGGLDVASGALDSLRFAAEITYGGISMLATSVASIRGAQGLAVKFLPDFRFIPRVADILVDRSITPFYWKAVIDKPKFFGGDVSVDLKTPPGVSAGAVQRTLELESGAETQTFQFPLVAGKLMADGVSRLILTLREGGEALAIDTATIRVAGCEIDPKRALAFLPDSLGLLEDILRMTDADFLGLTNRALETADLSAYRVILFGSGCLKSHPSLLKVRERLERYVRQGGLLVLFGQSEDWPDDVLPLKINTSPSLLDGADLIVNERSHRVFSRPYTILTRQLTAGVDGGVLSTPAEMTFGRKLITDSRSGNTLLSIANMGEGRIIYCGFPLLEQIARLEIHSIHLLANLINY
ncbi:MAG: hypothetical protein ACE5GA_01290 [Candidatus Zixiibacteriota bacterium]